ncbi:MAG: tetratricopeptide repeat protein [Bacteroidota bacterium]
MTTSNTTRLERWSSTFFHLFIRSAIVLALITLLYLVYRGYQDDRYLIQDFHVPVAFEESGVDGTVLSRKIQDEVRRLKEEIFVAKKDTVELEATDAPDLQVDVMGVGLSVNSITYHVKNLFGKKSNIITGELVEMQDQLELTMRMTGYKPKVHRVPCGQNKLGAFDSLLTLAALGLLEITDPYRTIVYYIDNKKHQQALQWVNWMVSQPTDREWGYVAWGQLLSDQNRLNESNEMYRKALAIKPGFTAARKYLAWNEFTQRNYQEALKQFEICRKHDADDQNALNGHASTLRMLTRYEEALDIYDQLIEKDPSLPYSYQQAAYTRLMMADTAGAIMTYQKATRHAKDGFEKYRMLSGYHNLVRQVDSVIYYANKMLEIQPNNLEALINITHECYYSNQFERALSYKDRLLVQKTNKNYSIHYRKQAIVNVLAMAHYKLAQYEEAHEMVDIAIGMNASANYPYTTKAEIYGLQGNAGGFCSSVSIALEKGFNLEDLLTLDPYNRYLNEPCFREIIRQFYQGRDMAVPVQFAGK